MATSHDVTSGIDRVLAAGVRQVRHDATRNSTEHNGTRERILDIALELFSTQGYETTSLRQIAERLGFSKAAIYYHFASKDDILMALHLRLHDFMNEAVSVAELADTSPKAWERLLDRLIDQILEHHDLFVLQERNHAVIETLHSEGHESSHGHFEEWFRLALSNQELPLRERVRLACAYKAVMGVLDIAGDVFAEVPPTTLATMVREAVNDFVAPKPNRKHAA
jgi:AcrR family transcriptional regulator